MYYSSTLTLSATKKGRRNVKGFSRKRKTHERNRLTNILNLTKYT